MSADVVLILEWPSVLPVFLRSEQQIAVQGAAPNVDSRHTGGRSRCQATLLAYLEGSWRCSGPRTSRVFK